MIVKTPNEANFWGNDRALLDQLLSASREASGSLSQRVTPRQLATVLVFNGPRDDGSGDVDAVAQMLIKVLPLEPSGVLNAKGRAAKEQASWGQAMLRTGLASPLSAFGRRRVETLQQQVSRERREEQRKHTTDCETVPTPTDHQYLLINLAELDFHRELLNDLRVLGSVGADWLMKALAWTQVEKRTPAPHNHQLSDCTADAPSIDAQAKAICERLGIGYNNTRQKQALRGIVDRELHGIVSATDIEATFSKLDRQNALKAGRNQYKVGPTFAFVLTCKDKGQRAAETGLRIVTGTKSG